MNLIKLKYPFLRLEMGSDLKGLEIFENLNLDT